MCFFWAYWVNTGKNEILEDVLKTATEDITERLYVLLQEEKVIARIDWCIVLWLKIQQIFTAYC